MPHPHFAGVVAGSHCDLVIPPHVHHDLPHVIRLWFPVPAHKPPDPVCDVKVHSDTCGGHNAAHDINQHEAHSGKLETGTNKTEKNKKDFHTIHVQLEVKVFREGLKKNFKNI